MKTLGSILQMSADFVGSRRTAEELLAHVLKRKRLDLYLQFDQPLEESEIALLRPLLQRAKKGEPLQYILGAVDFYDCEIAVSRAALIPRQETELLVDEIVKQLRALPLEGSLFWDLCTGSGCIGIAVKKALPVLEVELLDLSAEALALAKENVVRNGLEIVCKQGDLFGACEGRKAHFLSCNPPYISTAEFSTLQESVRNWEPKMALVGGEDGLDFYRRLSREAPARLHSGARLFLEIGASQGEAVLALFSEAPWREARLAKDLAGHPRFIFLERD
jgi:release factor glutamine methyltransferase